MTFFLLARPFFTIFCYDFNYWGDGVQILGGCIPLGFAALPRDPIIESRGASIFLGGAGVFFGPHPNRAPSKYWEPVALLRNGISRQMRALK